MDRPSVIDDLMWEEEMEELMELAMLSQLAESSLPLIEGRPCKMSILTGRMWVIELLEGHPQRMYDNFGIRKRPFKLLCNLLVEKGLWVDEPQQRVDVVESLGIFLHCVSRRNHHIDLAERFQHSTKTICHHVAKMSRLLVSLAPDIICPQNWETVHPKILNDNRHFPFFRDCVGAIDGTSVAAWTCGDRLETLSSKKNVITQNVLAVVDHDMRFMFMHAGWDGSAHDGRVFLDVVSRQNPKFVWPPHGKYYLVDANYGNQPGFLAPYKGEYYHKSQFAGSSNFRSPKELFNHRHSSLRNVIERTFSVLKKRYPILKAVKPPYKLLRQCNILIACCVVHNFIRENDIKDYYFKEIEDECGVLADEETITWPDGEEYEYHPYSNPQQMHDWAVFRDSIAKELWEAHLS